MTTFRCFLWIRNGSAAARSERVIKRRSGTLAFAIGYCLPVNHLPWYCITDGEPAGRYLDTRFLRV